MSNAPSGPPKPSLLASAMHELRSLCDLRTDMTEVAVLAVIVQFFGPQDTKGEDSKSSVLLVDPSMDGGKHMRVNIFLPSKARHPRLSRVGDVFLGCRLRPKAFRDSLELTLYNDKGAFLVVDGNLDAPLPVDLSSSPEWVKKVQWLREWRSTQMLEPSFAGKNCSGPFLPSWHPPTFISGAVTPNNAVVPLVSPPSTTFGAVSSSALLAPVTLSTNQSVAPAPQQTLVAKIQKAQALEKRCLGSLEPPIAGNRGYICDLLAVRITNVSLIGNGQKTNMLLWDNTGREVQATCWDPNKSQHIVSAVEVSQRKVAFAQIGTVRVAANKMQPGEMEVHINDNSTIQFLNEFDPLVVSLLARGAPTTTVAATPVPTPAVAAASTHPPKRAANWKCGSCNLMNFPSRRACHRCGKAFDEATDKLMVAETPASAQVAPNAPPPLLSALELMAPSLAKRSKADLTEVMTSHMNEEILVLNPSTGNIEPRITRLVDVISKREENWKWVIEGRVVKVHPQETRHCTRPYCCNCSNPVVDIEEQVDENGELNSVIQCGVCGIKLKVSELQYRYMVQLDIRDGPVTLSVLVCGDGACTFFRTIPAVDLWSNHASHKLLASRLDRLVASNQTTQFAIFSYVPSHRGERVYQCFDTVLL